MSYRYNTIVVGSFMVNCYLYWDDLTGDGVIIDPGDEGLMIVDAVQKAGFTPRGILLTHGHVDHIGAVAQVKEEFNLPLYVGRGDESMLADPHANASIMLNEPVKITLPEFVLEDEQEVKIGSLTGCWPLPGIPRAGSVISMSPRVSCFAGILFFKVRSAAPTFRAALSRSCWSRFRKS